MLLPLIERAFCRIVASLVRAQPVPFLLNIFKWLLVAIPATACNSLLSYIQNKLAMQYRTRLTEEVMKQYLDGEGDQGKIFYKMGARLIVSSDWRSAHNWASQP